MRHTRIEQTSIPKYIRTIGRKIASKKKLLKETTEEEEKTLSMIKSAIVTAGSEVKKPRGEAKKKSLMENGVREKYIYM